LGNELGIIESNTRRNIKKPDNCANSMDYKFQRNRIDKIPREKMIDELEKAAKAFNYIEFGWRDFDRVSGIGANVVKREFGGWKRALSALRESLNRKGMNLSPRPFAPNRIHSDKEMFEEIDRIWHKIGHRPSRNEWESSEPMSRLQFGKE
jgi:hypothetical protein